MYYPYAILITALILFPASKSFGQNTRSNADSRDGFTYGIQAGVNEAGLANVSQNDFGDVNFQSKFKTGFTAGIFFDIPLLSMLHLQPEVNYSLMGYKANTDQGAPFSRNYNVVDVPVFAKLFIVKHLYFLIGPQLSYTASSYDFTSSNDPTALLKYQRRDYDIRKANFGAAAGLGVDLSKHILANIGYSMDISRNYKTQGYDTPGFRNQVMTARLGYRF